MKDDLGNRMKEFYENITKTFLPRRTYTIIRIDGKAFHTYTKGLKKPFDMDFINDMDNTACYLCENIQGAKLAFVQSDEISILLTDFDNLKTDSWFGGNVQKITSVSASLATAKFNQLRIKREWEEYENGHAFERKLAMFDSRVFTIPSFTEVGNYFIWRQQDTVRNSISSVSQFLYSHKELNGKNTNEMQEMCFQKGVNWDEYDPRLKRGRLVVKEPYENNNVVRTKWVSIDSPIFTKNREILNRYIPENE